MAKYENNLFNNSYSRKTHYNLRHITEMIWQKEAHFTCYENDDIFVINFIFHENTDLDPVTNSINHINRYQKYVITKPVNIIEILSFL